MTYLKINSFENSKIEEKIPHFVKKKSAPTILRIFKNRRVCLCRYIFPTIRRGDFWKSSKLRTLIFFLRSAHFRKIRFLALGPTLMVWQKNYWNKKVATHWDETFLWQKFFSQTPQKPSKCPKHKNRYFSTILAIFDPLEGF